MQECNQRHDGRRAIPLAVMENHMDPKISALFEQLRTRQDIGDAEISPFASALTDVVTGGFQSFCNGCGGGGGGSDQ
jgi:hypothetical protein